MEEKTLAQNIIEVNMAHLVVAQAPGSLVTRALGSCVGITLWDPERKTGGMAHAMLPDINKARTKTNPGRFVNSAIVKMVEDLERMGSPRRALVAKLFGGAHMFAFISADSMLNIGQKNVEMSHAMLQELGIRLHAQETGGTFGRTIALNLETGKVIVSTISWGEKEM
jgi:chemotaxis protein CheD